MCFEFPISYPCSHSSLGDVCGGGVWECLHCRLTCLQSLGLHQASAAQRSLPLLEHRDSQLASCCFHCRAADCRGLDFTVPPQHTKECIWMCNDQLFFCCSRMTFSVLLWSSSHNFFFYLLLALKEKFPLLWETVCVLSVQHSRKQFSTISSL